MNRGVGKKGTTPLNTSVTLPVDTPTSCMLLRLQSKEQSGLTDQQTGPTPPPSPPPLLLLLLFPHLGLGQTPALVSLSVRFVTYGNAVD